MYLHIDFLYIRQINYPFLLSKHGSYFDSRGVLEEGIIEEEIIKLKIKFSLKVKI